MEQSPAPNKKIVKGDTIRVVVSFGPRPEEKVMVDLSSVPQAQAIDFLKGMELGLQFLPKMESSSTIKEGCVTRTDPAEGEELKEGQTVIIWVSDGPVQKMAIMPDLVGKSQTLAETLLTGANFHNYTIIEVESEELKGTVLEQSHKANTNMDVNTLIELKVSKGMPENPDDTQQPEQDNSVEKVVTLELPAEIATFLEIYFEEHDGESCILSIFKGNELVEEREFFEGTISMELKLRGEGLVTYTAMVGNDDSTAWTFDVNFVTEEENPDENPEEEPEIENE